MLVYGVLIKKPETKLTKIFFLYVFSKVLLLRGLHSAVIHFVLVRSVNVGVFCFFFFWHMDI